MATATFEVLGAYNARTEKRHTLEEMCEMVKTAMHDRFASAPFLLDNLKAGAWVIVFDKEYDPHTLPLALREGAVCADETTFLLVEYHSIAISVEVTVPSSLAKWDN